MAKFPNRNLTQTAVYWGSPSDDGYGGYLFADPVAIECRWVASTRLIRNADGEEIVSRAEVQVSQDVDENGYLYLGALADLDSDEEDNPMKKADAYKIQRFDKTPTIRGNQYFRKAYL